MQSDGSLHLIFTGILRDNETGRRVDVTWDYTIADDGTAAVLIDVNGRRIGHQCGHVNGVMTRFLHAACFGDIPPLRETGDLCPRDPVNIDGTPHARRVLNRWWVRRNEPQSTAAD